MTIEDRIRREIRRAQAEAAEMELRINAIKDELIIKYAATDAYDPFTPGYKTSHAANDMAVYGTRHREAKNRIAMLEEILNGDEEE